MGTGLGRMQGIWDPDADNFWNMTIFHSHYLPVVL